MLTESHSVRLAVENGLETSEAYSTGLRYKVIDFSLPEEMVIRSV